MKWDFSIRQRAEDRIQEDLRWAAQQRLLKQALGQADETVAAAPAGQRASYRVYWLDRIRRKLTGVIGISALLIILVAPQGWAASVAEVARHLAENVLGQGTVRMIRTADEGQTVLIRWESATYRAYRSIADSRELLYGESLLATGAVLGRMPDVLRIRFTILQGGQILATGENHRGTGLSLGFAKQLGGGFYIRSDSQPPKRLNSPGGQAAQQQ